MTSILFELAGRFPADVDDAPSSPARILETEFRLTLRRRLGALESALDHARPRLPDRLGVGLRPYEPGDALRTLSRSHLMRTGELLTRTDPAPGRQRCRIFYLNGSGMGFRSPDVPACKGQVALAAGALVECAHAGWGHAVRFQVVPNLATLGQLLRRRMEHIYVLTDLLWAHEGVERAGDSLLATLADAGVSRAAIFVVRDPWEQPVDNPLGSKGARLIDFLGDEEGGETRFSGDDYIRNLRVQLEIFNAASRVRGFEAHLVTGRTRLDAILEALCDFAGARRPA